MADLSAVCAWPERLSSSRCTFPTSESVQWKIRKTCEKKGGNQCFWPDKERPKRGRFEKYPKNKNGKHPNFLIEMSRPFCFGVVAEPEGLPGPTPNEPNYLYLWSDFGCAPKVFLTSPFISAPSAKSETTHGFLSSFRKNDCIGKTCERVFVGAGNSSGRRQRCNSGSITFVIRWLQGRWKNECPKPFVVSAVICKNASFGSSCRKNACACVNFLPRALSHIRFLLSFSDLDRVY